MLTAVVPACARSSGDGRVCLLQPDRPGCATTSPERLASRDFVGCQAETAALTCQIGRGSPPDSAGGRPGYL